MNSTTSHSSATRDRCADHPIFPSLVLFRTQRVGQTGPLLLQDIHLIEMLSHFDRERIPERVVHAKGGGAHGVFRLTHPIPELTAAKVFSVPGTECPITVRFSTVGGESGSPDAARDPRGFSIKMRTEEGNLDWVFNNTPVFFLRDPAKFPQFIHTQKRDPRTHATQGDDSTHVWNYASQVSPELGSVMRDGEKWQRRMARNDRTGKRGAVALGSLSRGGVPFTLKWRPSRRA